HTSARQVAGFTTPLWFPVPSTQSFGRVRGLMRWSDRISSEAENRQCSSESRLSIPNDLSDVRADSDRRSRRV
ncbi:MAG: hypothetical protein ACK56I_13800, partial [bacterium]